MSLGLKLRSSLRPRRGWTILTATVVAGLVLVPPVAAEARESNQIKREQRVERTLSQLAPDSIELREFFTELPKGADLHQHLSGTVYAESLLRWAAEDGLCIDVVTYVASAPPCTAGQETASRLIGDPITQSQIIANWSMRMFVPTGTQSGHDHFFATFGKFGQVLSTPTRKGDALAEILDQAARDSVVRVETKITPNSSGASKLAQDLSLNAPDVVTDPSRFSEALAVLRASGLDDVAQGAVLETDEIYDRRDSNLACNTPAKKQGCEVDLGLVAQVNRNASPAKVFAGLATGFATAAIDPRWIAVDLVSPEDGLIALSDYTLHMEMVRFLRSEYPEVNVTLHAGEFVPGTVPPPSMESHIGQAVLLAGANRIGHGVSIRSERQARNLLREMRRRGVTVEISLTSNEQILGVQAATSQFLIYWRAGVPVVLSTDDAGVERIDLTHEYIKAFDWFDLSYADLKKLSYQGIESAFVSADERKSLRERLDRKFDQFERKWARTPTSQSRSGAGDGNRTRAVSLGS